MFRTLLIANRGEIALRIVRACQSLGVESVVAHSEVDAGAPWVEAATRSICVGPARPDRSYLDINAMLQAAEQMDCQAVHPGYGFLAENALFAARCEQQGITFIGPSAESIREMGDKSRAKAAMAAAGLPTIPGSKSTVADPRQAESMADEIGYPVLLKASAGGGGKGMRLCRDRGELARGFLEATNESQQSFGNSALYLEKFISGGRHIEFQVLGDGLGRAIHLGERECSIQRKHQKLVEESPSPAVDAECRARFGRQVAEAIARLRYKNAGTVEFLRDESGQFYFMEMNTRLQVEHPVTEMVTGIDLVQEQLRIACNEPLSLRQEQVELRGHAMEFRINAEDPDAGFRPDPGLVGGFEPPAAAENAEVRWDSAIRPGYRIPPHYDSMVGKLIVHAADRPTVMLAADAALASLSIEGVKTTREFHRRLLNDAGFRSGSFDVNYLERSGILRTE